MKRKLWISALCMMACLASAAGVTSLKDVMKVSANTTATPILVEDAELVMKKGASVRYATSAEKSGLRFTVTLPEADYLGLEANEGVAYQSVKYGVALMPYTYLESFGRLTEENLFGNSAIYDWAVLNQETGEWIYSGDNTTKKRIMLFSSDIMVQDTDDETMYAMSGSISGILYDNLARDFVGLGFIEATLPNGEKEYRMAEYFDGNVHNNVRSIVEVAEKAVVDPEVTDQNKLDALVEYYLDATSVRQVKFYDGNTLLGTHESKKNYAINNHVTVGDGFSYWEDENGNAVNTEGYEITGTTKLYAVYSGSAEAVADAQNAIAAFLSTSVSQSNVAAVQAQYEELQEKINALRASDYNTYISEEICASINAKAAEVNTVLENADDLFEIYEGVILDGTSVSLPQGTKTALNLPLINYTLYKEVSFDWSVSGWSQVGQGNDLWHYESASPLGGTVTVVNNGNGELTFTMTETKVGNKSYSKVISDSAIINGQAPLPLHGNSLVNTQTLSIGPISATSLYNVWAIDSNATLSQGLSVSLPQDKDVVLNLPLLNYSLYESVTFDWSTSQWAFAGQGSDLWYYNAGSALGGTVTIVNNGSGGLTFTMSETKVGQGTHSKTISDSAIVNGQAPLTLNAKSLVNTQSLSIGAITAKAGLAGRMELAVQAGKTPKTVTSVIYTGQSMVDNTSVLDANGNKPMISGASTFIDGGVNYDCSGGAVADWTVYLPKINYLAYKTVSLQFQATNTWQTFGFVNGGRLADGNAGALAGTITFTNNGDGTVTCVINENVKGSISYTITDSEVLNGSKAFTLFWNQGAPYRQMSFGPISATYTLSVDTLDEISYEEKEVIVVDPYVYVGEKVFATQISVGCNNGETVTLTLPAIPYAIYEKVTFNWSSHDWMMVGQGSDLWFSALGSGNMSGTGTIVANGDGQVTLTLTENAKGTHSKDIPDSEIYNGQKGFELSCYGWADSRSFVVTNVTAHNGKEPVTSGPIEYILKDFSASIYETTVYDTDALERGELLVRTNTNGDGRLYLETQNANGGDSTENTYTISLPWVDFTALNYIRTRISASNGTGIGFAENDMMEVAAYVDLTVAANVVNGKVVSLTATLKNSNGVEKTTTITDTDVIRGDKGVSFYVKGIQYSAYYMEDIFANGKSSVVVNESQELLLDAQSGSTSYSEYRIAWDANNEWTNDYHNYEFAAKELASFLGRWTGETYQLVKMYDGSAIQKEDKLIVLGGKLAQEAGLSLDGLMQTGGYKIVQDYSNLYIYSETVEGTLAGVYGFLKEQADVTFYTDEVFTENVTQNSLTVGAGTSLTFNPSFSVGQAGYSEIQNSEAYQRRMGLYADWYVTAGAALRGAATTWAQSLTTGTHNMLDVFPYETYASQYSDWYVTVSGTTQLNFTSSNTHLQEMKNMFVASAKVAIANMPQVEYFEFGQPDSQYGPDVAGYLAFMNDVAASLDAWLKQENPDRTVALVMYAYNSTRMAPTSGEIYDGDNVYVAVCFAPVGMRYTDKIDAENSYHKDTNANKWVEDYTTYEALTSWTKLSGFNKDRSLIYWMYGTDFFNYFMPMDTISNLQYNYQKLYETGANMIKYQFQTNGVDSVGSDWQRLKTYLASELTKDVNADVATLQANFMNAMYGAGAEYMQQLLAAQQAHCTYDNFNSLDGTILYSNYTELYFGVINGSEKLMSSRYFSKNTLKTWMGYIDNAKAAVNADASLTDEEKTAYIERIEVEALSIRYMLITLHSDKTYDASLTAWKTHAASLGCHTEREGGDTW